MWIIKAAIRLHACELKLAVVWLNPKKWPQGSGGDCRSCTCQRLDHTASCWWTKDQWETMRWMVFALLFNATAWVAEAIAYWAWNSRRASLYGFGKQYFNDNQPDNVPGNTWLPSLEYFFRENAAKVMSRAAELWWLSWGWPARTRWGVCVACCTRLIYSSGSCQLVSWE